MARMKLVTKEIEELFARTGSQDGKGADAKVILKVFNPCGSQTWYLTEYDPETRIFFGFASLFGGPDDEWGYVSLDEMESIRLPFGLFLERDRHFGTPKAGQVGPIRKRMGWPKLEGEVS